MPLRGTPHSIRRRLTVAIAASGVLVLSNALPASASPYGHRGEIVSGYDTSKCLDLDAFTPQNGAKIQAWDCNGLLNQDWVFFGLDGPRGGPLGSSIRSRLSPGMCLDEDISSRTHNGTRVQLWECNGWDNQQWTRLGDDTIRSIHDGRCLDLDIGSPVRNGTRVQVWNCARADSGPNALFNLPVSNQRWDLPTGLPPGDPPPLH
ncbi:ricin-type beta-trefoil lectin domain protein [Frankia sp. AiPs1]|uniref:RICIN domain-containing protein n=1 Tax=Frankia sp. AiPs1 TaxID=573493 RepID=UPI00204466AE|nr:ricin-type beta-trefoil lectin domain protein [Frankia sp. AiPs1]MCM3923277.1 ricin-type beta-trefoil lectin domain protein [Frankia sp. AiPs1]